MSGTFKERNINIVRLHFKLGDINQTNYKVFSFPYRKISRHSMLWFIQIAHAVNPGIHILSIEIWEAKLLLKVRMERIPTEDFRCIDVDDVYSIVGFHGAIVIVF